MGRSRCPDTRPPWEPLTTIWPTSSSVTSDTESTQTICSPWRLHPATVRASFGVYNTREEVERLVEGISKVQELFS